MCFLDDSKYVYPRLWPLSVFSQCQCMYTHQAGRTPALQQNWQSSEKSWNYKEKTQYLMNTLYVRISACPSVKTVCSLSSSWVSSFFQAYFRDKLFICLFTLYLYCSICFFFDQVLHDYQPEEFLKESSQCIFLNLNNMFELWSLLNFTTFLLFVFALVKLCFYPRIFQIFRPLIPGLLLVVQKMASK